jgi:hypothetical protein
MHYYFPLFLLLFLPSGILAFATIDDFTTDKTLYHTGDSLVISGSVDYDPTLFSIILQIITPSGNGLAHVDSIIPKNNGDFSKTLNVGGPTWSENGKYTIKISYGGNLEKSIEYLKTTNDSPKDSNTISSESNLVTKPDLLTIESDATFTENPKMRILGFPSLDKSPQYYIDRYNNEPSYKSWFDSQFPGQTIYSVLGFSTYIPDWIKTYAQNWASGEISDQEFMGGLDFMLQNNIIVISNFNYEHSSIDNVPSWFRNTAHWWSTDLISQQEFINSIKYLIQEDVILIE